MITRNQPLTTAQRSIHPMKLFQEFSRKRQSRDFQDFGLTLESLRAMWEKQSVRYEREKFVDPVFTASRTRPFRTASRMMEALIEEAERFDVWQTESRRREAESLSEAAVRKSLLMAARTARQNGWHVRSSKSRDGTVSSYYASEYSPTLNRMVKLRISDHEIPWSQFRDDAAFDRGKIYGFEGFDGPEIIVDKPLTSTFILRSLTLALHGRL